MLERLASFYALMLPCVSDEQNAVAGLQLGEEVAHLFGASEAGFIDHEQVPLWSGLTDACEETLQGVGKDSGVTKLVRRA